MGDTSRHPVSTRFHALHHLFFFGYLKEDRSQEQRREDISFVIKMSDHRAFFGLVLLILAVSFDHVRNEKISCSRSSGLVPYPRTGRSSEMTDFHRSSRTSGLIHYPRVGRSDLPVFYVGANRKNDLGSTIDLEFFPEHGSDIDSTYEPDYEEIRPGLATIARYVERNYPKEKHDDSRPYNLALRGSHNRQGQLMMSVPRIGRDISDQDGPMNLL